MKNTATSSVITSCTQENQKEELPGALIPADFYLDE